MKFFATIVHIAQTTEVGASKFKIRKCWLKTNEQYPQTVEFQFQGERTSLLDGFAVNDTVELEFNVNGKEITNKDGYQAVINTLVAWKISKK